MTDAEWRLWYHLRAHRFLGRKFRRQVPMGPYTVDFLCEQVSLIVEVDGGQHSARVKKDAARSRWLEAQGYAVIRFWNNDVLANTEGVLAAIAAALADPARSSPMGEADFGDPLPGPLPRERKI